MAVVRARAAAAAPAVRVPRRCRWRGGAGGAGGAGAEGGAGGAGGAGAGAVQVAQVPRAVQAAQVPRAVQVAQVPRAVQAAQAAPAAETAFDPCVDIVEDADLRLTNDFGVLFTEGGLLGIEWGPQGAAMAHLNVTLQGTGRRDIAINVVVVPADDPDRVP